MHLRTHVRAEHRGRYKHGDSEYIDGMQEHDDIVGNLLKALDDMGIANNTIVVYSSDNGPHMNTWPDGAMTPFRSEKNTNWEGAFRVPCLVRWPGVIRPGTVSNEIMSHNDWIPTLCAAAGEPDIVNKCRAGYTANGINYKVHLDGYNQLDLITGKGPSARDEILYFTEGTLSAVRINDFKYRFTDQPSGWLGATVKVDWPILTNLRLDPFERTGMYNGKDNGSISYYNWFVFEFWRFQFAQQEIGQYAATFLEYPPMQKGASFNLEALKAELEAKMEAMKARQSQ
jgi:arylsulfatase A-like enzyme